MQAIKISVQIEEDRIIHIHVPDDVPLGRAEVTIQPLEMPQPEEETREVLRARLAARGRLSTAFQPREGVVLLSQEELDRIGTLPPNARPSHELIDEDRGPR